MTMRWRIHHDDNGTRVYAGDQDVTDLVTGVTFTRHAGETDVHLELNSHRVTLDVTTTQVTTDEELRTRQCIGCSHPDPGDSSGVCLVPGCNCTGSWHAPF